MVKMIFVIEIRLIIFFINHVFSQETQLFLQLIINFINAPLIVLRCYTTKKELRENVIKTEHNKVYKNLLERKNLKIIKS